MPAGGASHLLLLSHFPSQDSTEPRKADGRVPIARVPDLVRALGYYPTEAEVGNMVAEASADAERAASAAATAAGAALRGSISLEGFIKLYVNHRPVFGVGKGQIEAAFGTLSSDNNGGSGSGGIAWDEMARMLQSEGEKMSAEELQRCLGALVGDEDLPSTMTATAFADTVLGFEDYDAGGDEGGGLDAGEE